MILNPFISRGMGERFEGNRMHVIEAKSSDNTINYPDHASEFEVHAELYYELKKINGCEIRGEVKSRGTHGLRKTKTACRFDLVVYLNEKAICIIEVKGNEVKHKTTIEDTRQGVRYSSYGVPVIVCYGFEDVDQVKSYVENLIVNL